MLDALTIFLIILALVWVITATVSDLKKREVPDWLNFSLIAIAIIARLLFSFSENNFSYLLNGMMYLGIFFILANLLYYAKVFAGGDVKLLIGLGVVLAEPPRLLSINGTNSILPLPFTFLANLFLIGSVYGLLFTFYYALKNRKSFLKEFGKRKGDVKPAIFLLIALLFIFLAVITKNYNLTIFSLLIIFFPYLYMVVKVIEDTGMTAMVSPKKLTEGDWLAKEVNVQGKIIKPTWEGLSKKEITLLQKAGKNVFVKYGLPFVPAFLLTLIATFLLGNLFEVILMFFF